MEDPSCRLSSHTAGPGLGQRCRFSLSMGRAKSHPKKSRGAEESSVMSWRSLMCEVGLRGPSRMAHGCAEGLVEWNEHPTVHVPASCSEPNSVRAGSVRQPLGFALGVPTES